MLSAIFRCFFIQYFIFLLFGSQSFASVSLVVDQNTLSAIFKTLDSAEKSVNVIQVSFEIDSKGKIDENLASFQIAKKLVEIKKKHGPEFPIRVYLEKNWETASRNKIAAEFLKKMESKFALEQHAQRLTLLTVSEL